MVLPNRLSLPPASIFLGVIKIWEFLTWFKVDLVFNIVNVMCESASAALEQVAGNRLAYVLGGLACAVVAIVLAVGELLWMKKKNQKIGILDCLGFLAALSQLLPSIVHVVFVCLHKSSPINISFFSLIFALVSAVYKIFRKTRTHEFVIYCEKNIHHLPLKVRKEIRPTKTLFECPLCASYEQEYSDANLRRKGKKDGGDIIEEEESSYEQGYGDGDEEFYEESINIGKEH